MTNYRVKTASLLLSVILYALRIKGFVEVLALEREVLAQRMPLKVFPGKDTF
jgi:hypothetical protein